MKYYSGLDVSLKETFISIIDEKGLTVKEGFVPTDVESISSYLKESGLTYDEIGSDESCQLKVLLGSRRQLVTNRQQLKGTVRGLLKIYGIKLGGKAASESFEIRVSQVISTLDPISCGSISALLESLKAIEESLTKLDKILSALGQKDEDCQRLMTVPGVGAITAMTYKAALDDPGRFEKIGNCWRLYGSDASAICFRGG